MSSEKGSKSSAYGAYGESKSKSKKPSKESEERKKLSERKPYDEEDGINHRSLKKSLETVELKEEKHRQIKSNRKPAEIIEEEKTEKHKSGRSKLNEDNNDEKSRKSHRSNRKNQEEIEDTRHYRKKEKDNIEKEETKEERRERRKIDEKQVEDERKGRTKYVKEEKHDRNDRSKHRYESKVQKEISFHEETKKEDDEPVYDEDFDDDFEDESESEKEPDTKTQIKNRNYSSEEEVVVKKSSSNKDRQLRDRHDRDNDYDDYNKGRIVKANAHVQVPTESVEIYSSKIFFNHDSLDRQQRRAKDLLKTIELDKKSFNLLDINPEEMHTVYSSHLKHEKIQTNDDVFEIEVQTDDIDYVTRWTQYPPDDSKGYGTDDLKQLQDYEDHVLEKFRLEINFIELQNFLNKSSKVLEAILAENNANASSFLSENKSDLPISKGFTKFNSPKLISKFTKNALLSNCTFCMDDPNYVVCSYDIQTSPDRYTYSLLVVWNINEPSKPYRILLCESKSTCLCYTSFMVFSGNIDGTVVVWDLRESYNLHLLNLKKKGFSSEYTILRSPTYATAGVLLNENHFSEVKTIISLQNQMKEHEKGVFMQLATLEIDCKLIIWTVVELNHVDLAGFETDLGLLPGGKIKLVKSSQIDLNNLISSPFGKFKYHTLNMTCPTNQTNHFFISTSLGRIIHVLRESESSSITTMRSEFTDGSLQVTCVSFHPFLQDVLLAGYGNGELRLYHIKYILPIKTWQFACQGSRIKHLDWIETKASSFICIDEQDNLYVWDLLIDDTESIMVKKMNGFAGIALPHLKQGKLNENIPFAVFNSDSIELEIHMFSPEWSKRNEKDSKKFAKLIKNFLLTF